MMVLAAMSAVDMLDYLQFARDMAKLGKIRSS